MSDDAFKPGWEDGFALVPDAEQLQFVASPERQAEVARLLLVAGALSRTLSLQCPRCGWVASATATWPCKANCGQHWNVFSTGGQCPTCGELHPETECQGCSARVSHLDWYLQTTVDR